MKRDRPRVAFVVPRSPRIGAQPALRRLWATEERFRTSSFFLPLPNLALLTLAALANEECEPTYLDENLAPLPRGRRFDVAAVTAMTCQAPRAYRLAARLQSRGSHVVLGGIHPTVMTQEALGHAQTVVAGEGERSWKAFLADFAAGRPGREYRAADAGWCDLRESPIPRYDLAPPGAYLAWPVQVGRGCSLGCEFCSVGVVHGVRHRHKPVEQVVEEIRAVRSAAGEGRPRIFFTDDNLCLHRGLLEQLCSAVAPLKVNWMAQMDIGVARHPELLRAMAASGCTQLLVGFESLNPRALERIQPRGPKPTLVGEYAALARRIQQHGIRVLGMFIVGLDEDRPAVFRGLREFILGTHLHDVQVTIQTPLPGTALRERLAAEGRLLAGDDWSQYAFFNVAFRPRHLTARQLIRGQSRLYREFHSPEAAARRRGFWLDLARQRVAAREATRDEAGSPGGA
jgi:radical SAM superfamily enzyme YgiQ (UPF0313 family)